MFRTLANLIQGRKKVKDERIFATKAMHLLEIESSRLRFNNLRICYASIPIPEVLPYPLIDKYPTVTQAIEVLIKHAMQPGWPRDRIRHQVYKDNRGNERHYLSRHLDMIHYDIIYPQPSHYVQEIEQVSGPHV